MDNELRSAEEKRNFWSSLFYASFLLPFLIFLLAIITYFKLSILLLLAFGISNYFIIKKCYYYRNIVIAHRNATYDKLRDEELARKSDKSKRAFSELAEKEYAAMNGVLRSLLSSKAIKDNAELHVLVNEVMHYAPCRHTDGQADALWALYKSEVFANIEGLVQSQIATIILFYERYLAARHIKNCSQSSKCKCPNGPCCCPTDDNRINFYSNLDRTIKNMTGLTVEEFATKNAVDLDVITQHDKYLIGTPTVTES